MADNQEGFNSIAEAISAVAPIADTAVAEPPVAEAIVETPPAAEPPATEPPATPPSSEPPAEPEFTEQQQLQALSKTFGRPFASMDEVNAFKGELDNIPTYKQKIEQFEKTPPKPKFANPYIEELNNFSAATGLQDAKIFTDLKRYTNTENKDHIEALVLAEIISDPSLSDDRDMLRLSISRKYNLTIDPDADEAAETSRVELEKFNLKRDAGKANTLINETMSKVTSYKEALPPDTTAENQQKMEANQSAWKGITSDIKFKENFKTVAIGVPKGKMADGTEIDLGAITVDLSPETIARIDANISGFVQQGYEPTPENIAMITAVQQKVAILENLPAYLAKVQENALAKAEEIYLKKYNNPSALAIETPNTPQVKDELDEVRDKILSGKFK